MRGRERPRSRPDRRIGSPDLGAADPSASDSELAVFRPLHPPVFADHHRGDGLAALDRRDVETLDSARDRRQVEDQAERFERVVVGGDGLVEARLVRDLRVARREVEQARASRRASARRVRTRCSERSVSHASITSVSDADQLDRQVDLRRRRMLGRRTARAPPGEFPLPPEPGRSLTASRSVASDAFGASDHRTRSPAPSARRPSRRAPGRPERPRRRVRP